MSHVMNSRPHCTCEVVENLPVERVAEILGFRVRKVREHLRFVPHQKAGDQRALCPCEVRLLQAHFTVTPGIKAAAQAEPDTTAATELHLLRPSRARRKSRTG